MNQENKYDEKGVRRLTMKSDLLNLFGRFSDWVWLESYDKTSLSPLRSFLRVFFILARELGKDRISLRASALTFTVVLSLVPVLALGTAVLKGLGAGDQMRVAAYKFIDQLEESPSLSAGLPSAPMEMPDTKIPPETETPSLVTNVPEGIIPGRVVPEVVVPENIKEEAAGSSMTGHLRRAVDQIFDYVDRTDFAALGAFGIFGVIFAAISVLGTIEQAMNVIWQVDSNRPFGRKVIDYLALMLLMPITINFALATETTLQSPALLNHLESIIPIVWLGAFLLKILPILALVATFVILYRFLPNLRVEFLPALAGGVFGGISWLIVQMSYVKLQIGVARYNAIYGSFATLPLFLLWIYVAWMVFLAGAEMAFAVQVRHRYTWNKVVLTPVVRLTLAFELMENVLADFRAGKLSDRTNLARQIRQSDATVSEIVDILVNAGKIHMVYGKKSGFVPAAPEETIEPAEFIDIIFGADIPEGRRHCSLAKDAMDGARQALVGKTILCSDKAMKVSSSPDTFSQGDL